jgi:hypothetical protein
MKSELKRLFPRAAMTLLVMLLTSISAWAEWDGGTYTATTNEIINTGINVNADATLTINSGVTITVNGGIVVADGKKLTITGSGTLKVYGINGDEGAATEPGCGNGNRGSQGNGAIVGNVIINGATVEATGGDGGNGGYAFSGSLILYGGTVIANGGDGGSGGISGTSSYAFSQSVTFEAASYTITGNGASTNDVIGYQYVDITAADAIPYLDADGNTQYCTNFTVLTGSETSLSAGWYVAQGTINYDHQIYFNGTAHLILADGCKMTVEPTNDNQVRAIEAGNLTIYAQSNGSAAGSLTAIINYPQDNSAGTAAIMGVRLTINGGNITARSTNTGNTTNAGHGGIAGQSGLTINGGNIVATSESTEKGCGITGPITINWNNDNCSLYFYPYRNDGFGSYMKIADGKTISDGTNTYSGTLSEEQKAAIVRKQGDKGLVPVTF